MHTRSNPIDPSKQAWNWLFGEMKANLFILVNAVFVALFNFVESELHHMPTIRYVVEKLAAPLLAA